MRAFAPPHPTTEPYPAWPRCEAANRIQQWQLVRHGGSEGGSSLVARGTDTAPGSDGYGVGGECVEHCISGECWFPKVQLWACGQKVATPHPHPSRNRNRN